MRPCFANSSTACDRKQSDLSPQHSFRMESRFEVSKKQSYRTRAPLLMEDLSYSSLKPSDALEILKTCSLPQSHSQTRHSRVSGLGMGL